MSFIFKTDLNDLQKSRGNIFNDYMFQSVASIDQNDYNLPYLFDFYTKITSGQGCTKLWIKGEPNA